MQDVLFERTVLSTLLQNKPYFSKVFGILKTDYFTEKRQDIFKLIIEHYQNYKEPCNLADCAIKIKNLQNAEHKNAVAAELFEVSKTDGTANLDAMCDETLRFVKDALYLRALEIGSEGLMTKSDELKLKAERILDERAKVCIDTDVGIEFHDATAVMDYYSTETVGLKTQHNSINARLGSGFTPGTLSLILAAAGIGKSLLMTDLISGFVKQGKNVLLVSLEMAKEEVMKRVHSNTLDIPIDAFEPKNFNKEQFVKKIQQARASGTGTFYAKDYPALSFSSLQLEALVETFKNEKGITFDVIFVDYLGIMKSDLISPAAGLYSYVKSMSEELRATAKRLKLPIISASQLNRSATNNTDADNAAVSDSYGTVATADFMLFLLQTEEMKANGDIIGKITKNRFNGRTDVFPMQVDYSRMRFLDPETPRSWEAQIDFASKFETNKAAAENQFSSILKQDTELAQKIDSVKSEPDELLSLNTVLENLIKS